jgi:transketolase
MDGKRFDPEKLDEVSLKKLAELASVHTGLGSIVANVLAEHRVSTHFRKTGITQYGSSGKPDDLYKMQGLDVDSLVKVVMDEIQKK